MDERTLRTLEGIHEHTEYRIKGREEDSQPWVPKRGLREGCSTSPILFNIYHSVVMRMAVKERKKRASEKGWECGIEWNVIPGHSLPPKDRTAANASGNVKTFRITESLFAILKPCA